MDSEDNHFEISIELPSSNLSHEQTPVAGASSVPQDESRGLNEMTPEDLDSINNKLIEEYADKDRWNEAEPIFNQYPDMVRIPLNYDKDRALHVAVKANSITFVKGLVNHMSQVDLEIENLYGYTAFYLAAKSGKCDLVQIMMEKNQNLPLIKPTYGWDLPVHRAANEGHHKIVQVLSSKTLLQEMEKMDPQNIKNLFSLTIERDMFDVAIKLFEECPALSATARNGGQTVLEMLWQKASEELSTKEGNNRGASSGESLHLLHKLCLQLKNNPEAILDFINVCSPSLGKAMVDALESGKVEALKLLVTMNPKILELTVNDNGQNILHYAVQQHHSIVSYICKMPPPDDILLAVDKNGNNILHLAAYPLEIEESSSSSRATTRMAREVARFEKHEKKFPRQLRAMENKEGKTPKDVFVDKHRDLSRQVKDTAKGRAESGMLVAALVATVAFAAALVVPGDKTNPWFTIFILANAAALFTSSATILSFLSNFTLSKFVETDFVIALHPSFILDPILLLISIVSMIISFAAASFLIFEHTSKWVAHVVASMGVFTILHFLLLQFSIFDEYVWSRFYRMSDAQ